VAFEAAERTEAVNRDEKLAVQTAEAAVRRGLEALKRADLEAASKAFALAADILALVEAATFTTPKVPKAPSSWAEAAAKEWERRRATAASRPRRNRLRGGRRRKS